MMKKKTSLSLAALLVAIPLLTACSSHKEVRIIEEKDGNGNHDSVATQPPTSIQAEENSPQQAPTGQIELPPANQWLTVQHDQAELQQLQDSATDGHATAYMSAEGAAREFVGTSDDVKLKAFVKGKLIDDQLASDGVIKLTTEKETLLLHVTQPVNQGKGGIWIVDRYITALPFNDTGERRY
ncbi:MAG TPA: hypothetical protein VFV52_02135 [Bacilli bacterium]|nr:hypothetical protein [Bacilli bacterium]